MTMRRETGRITVLLLTVGLALSVGPATGQQAPDPRLERIRAELPAAAVQQIERQLQRARDQRLPLEPLLDKAVEGMAKGVAGARIAGAVAQLGTQLGEARGLLGTGATPPAADITAVADALRRGVPDHAIRRIAERAGPDGLIALEVHAVGDLMDRGVPAEQALAAVEAWRARGDGPAGLRELPAAVERLIRQGTLPAHAAAAVTGAIHAYGPPGLTGQHPGAGVGRGNDGPPIPPGTGPSGRQDRGNKKPPGGGPPGGG